jgi:hypothetical protein
VALDERPVQRLDSARAGTRLAPGKVARRDYEYVRQGERNRVLHGCAQRWSPSHSRDRNRTVPQFANALAADCRAYPSAKTIHLLMDNLNTHCAYRPLRLRPGAQVMGALR